MNNAAIVQLRNWRSETVFKMYWWKINCEEIIPERAMFSISVTIWPLEILSSNFWTELGENNPVKLISFSDSSSLTYAFADVDKKLPAIGAL